MSRPGLLHAPRAYAPGSKPLTGLRSPTATLRPSCLLGQPTSLLRTTHPLSRFQLHLRISNGFLLTSQRSLQPLNQHINTISHNTLRIKREMLPQHPFSIIRHQCQAGFAGATTGSGLAVAKPSLIASSVFSFLPKNSTNATGSLPNLARTSAG